MLNEGNQWDSWLKLLNRKHIHKTGDDQYSNFFSMNKGIFFYCILSGLHWIIKHYTVNSYGLYIGFYLSNFIWIIWEYVLVFVNSNVFEVTFRNYVFQSLHAASIYCIRKTFVFLPTLNFIKSHFSAFHYVANEIVQRRTLLMH